jgi:hypothetical protein
VVEDLSLAENYFKKFPLTYYNNYLAVDITKRSAVTQDAFKNPYYFYPYDIPQGERPDQFADNYYNDQFMDWVLYLGNKTIDPYSWYMSENNFNNFLIKKYNVSIDVLQDKIAFYRNNWYEKEEKISVSEYAVLANNVHRYWQPYYNNSTAISGYERVKQDWIINTNSVRKYTANSSSFVNFKTNEIVDITFDVSNKGTGQVVVANSSSITLQNIYGTSLANSTVVISGTSYLKGRESSANAKFGTASNVVDNIPLNEVIYWSPVSVYEAEREKNEQKKSINVLDNRYSMRVSSELTKLMKI